MEGGQNQPAASGKSNEAAQGENHQEAIAPFLGKFNPLYRYFGGFRGQAVNQDMLSDEDKEYFYHATTLGNLESILNTGLDPERGGIGGAGTLIAGEEDYREPEDDMAQNMRRQRFNQKSHGYVHASEHPEVVVPYAYEYDEISDSNLDEVKNIPVILRFKKDVLKPAHLGLALMSCIWKFSLDPIRGYQSDPEQRGAIRTKTKVEWDKMEILTEEGWTPLAASLKNGKLVRDEISTVIQEIKRVDIDVKLEDQPVEAGAEQDPEATSFTELRREDGAEPIGKSPIPQSRVMSTETIMGK